MPLSWNEIKTRAIAFMKEWAVESREQAESKTFWNDFFNIFGISRRRVATFEQPVKKLNQHTGFIDLLWKGVLLIEHKSRGENLDHAAQQAKDYCTGLKEEELPKYLLLSDFQRFCLYDWIAIPITNLNYPICCNIFIYLVLSQDIKNGCILKKTRSISKRLN